MKKTFLFKLKLRILSWLTPEPEIQAEYVDKVVFLLRRDFNTKQQNEIIVSIASKLSALRKEDMTEMSKKYDVLQQDMFHLEKHILCS